MSNVKISREEIAKQLTGKRQDVENAARTIKTQIEQIRKGGTSSSVGVYALNYNVYMLRKLCLALQNNYYQYADIYCNIAASMLPHVAPCDAQPDYWTSHLTSLKYIHYALCKDQTLVECKSFYALINAQRCQLQTKSNYELYLNLHIKHIYHFGQQKPSASQVNQGLNALGQLFQVMLEQQHCPSQLIREVNEILGQRTISFLRMLGTLPVAQTNKCFEPLFKLLLCQSNATTEQLCQEFSQYLSAFIALLQLDGFAAQLKEQSLALQLLRCCRVIYKEVTAQNYVLQLFYNYVKLLLQPEADLQHNYIELGKKFVHFFQHKCATLVQEQWFIDFLFVFVRVQKQLHPLDTKLSGFEHFWQQLGDKNSAPAYTAHFELLQALTNMLMNVSNISPLSTICSNDVNCKSLRKHSIFTLGRCASVAYGKWQPEEQATLPKAAQHLLASLIGYAIDVANVTKCMLPTSFELVNFARQLGNIAEKVMTAEQFSLLQQLFEPLQALRPLLGEQDLCQLLRRIYKASSSCTNLELAAQLQSSYIVVLSNPFNQFQQMCYHYRTSKDAQRCIYELHEKSPLCNPLTTSQQHRLYERDMLAVLASKKTPVLLHSLLCYCKSDYQKVLLARHLRTDANLMQQLELLRLRLKRKQQLTRLQQLVFAHVTVSKLSVTLESQKIKIPIKETGEKFLEELLIKNNLLDFNIGSEMPLLELATTAINAFEYFYNQADAEHLSSDDALIDWEALIEDAVTAAMALSTMGYMPQADNAWLLLLRIGRMLGDRFSYLRALSHFMSRYTQHASFDMSFEVAHAQTLLEELWPQLHNAHFFKRHHTTVLLCLCHMALYYGRIGCMCNAQLLMLHAERLSEEFPERKDKCDIVLLTLQSVRIRLCYQQQQHQCGMLTRMPTSLEQMDTLTENVHNFVSISSMDQGALILLLCDLVHDTTECTANRLSERPNLSSSLLQILLQTGLALRSVEVLISWLWTNLRMELMDKAMSKLRLIDHFLCMQPLLESLSLVKRVSPSSLQAAAPMDAQTKHMSELVGKMLSMQLEQGSTSLEPIRKQQQRSPRLMQSPSSGRLKLERYMNVNMQQVHPLLRNSMQLQCIYFIVGCLHARLYYLNQDHEQLDDFYVLANAWLQQNIERRNSLGHKLLLLHSYQTNYLRAKQNYKKAIEISDAALKLASSEHIKQHLDVNYRYNLMLQLQTARLELQPFNKPKNQRRALKFNIKPEEKPKAVTKTNKPPKFEIYTDDFNPISSSGNDGSSPEFDLNACQIIELSDDELAPIAQPKLSKSEPLPTSTTRTTRAKKQAETLAVPTKIVSTASTSNSLAASQTKRNPMPEATPKTTANTRGRLRRHPASDQPLSSPLLLSDPVTTRRRQRN